jgi:hypothetical protein
MTCRFQRNTQQDLRVRLGCPSGFKIPPGRLDLGSRALLINILARRDAVGEDDMLLPGF